MVHLRIVCQAHELGRFQVLHEDAVAPARILNDFAKENEALEIKGGVIEGKVSEVSDIKALAALPNKEGMLSMGFTFIE